MSESKNISISGEELAGLRPAAQEVVKEGIVQYLDQPKNSLFERCLNYIRLDTDDTIGAAGRCSNAGQSLLR